MKHIIFILMFCCSAKTGFCGQFEQLDSLFRKTTTIQELKKCVSGFIADSSLTSKYEQINRSIDFNYMQVIYTLRWEYIEYEVYLILRNDTIVLGKIQELDYFNDNKIIKSSIFTKQSKMIDLYLEKHSNYYKTKVSRQNFIKQMTSSEEYGFACGLHRTHFSNPAKKTQKYVTSKNYKALAKMLRSVVPEIKTYGATGLIQLEKTGSPIKSKEKMILEHYKELNFMVFSCYGCLSGPETFKSVLEWEWETYNGKPQKRRIRKAW